jgi:hypothetical protein
MSEDIHPVNQLKLDLSTGSLIDDIYYLASSDCLLCCEQYKLIFIPTLDHDPRCCLAEFCT